MPRGREGQMGSMFPGGDLKGGNCLSSSPKSTGGGGWRTEPHSSQTLKAPNNPVSAGP